MQIKKPAGRWGQSTAYTDLRIKEREAKEESARIILALRGARHPEASGGQFNLAVMHYSTGDLVKAAEYMAFSLAINLSLDQLTHPNTQNRIRGLRQFWTASNQPEKATRLKEGDFSDLIPIVEQIEAEHRVWVAENPENRHFGPPSPITGATQ